MAKNEYLGLNLEQTLRKLKVAFKEKGVNRSDEFRHTDYIDFELSYKGWYVLCKVDMYYPYNAKFRLIGTSKYTSVKINHLVDAVNEVLFERFNSKTESDDTTEL